MAGAQIRVNSGNFITARPIGVRKGVDFQFTGAVRKVDSFAIRGALDAGEVVLVAHVGYSPTGEVFNLAWEDVAENVAIAMRADKLIMFTDRLPVDKRGEVVSELTAREAEALLKKGGLTQQATRAIEHAVRALGNGVGRAHILSRRVPGSLLLELFTASGVGTMITADTLEQLRPARIEDVGGMLSLIEPLEAEGSRAEEPPAGKVVQQPGDEPQGGPSTGSTWSFATSRTRPREPFPTCSISRSARTGRFSPTPFPPGSRKSTASTARWWEPPTRRLPFSPAGASTRG
jgi:hypothetical protein